MRINRSCLWIIHITEWCFGEPLSSAKFLADTTFYVFREIIRIIFGLTERHLQHEQSLGCGFEPVGNEAQRGQLFLVNKVNDETAVNAIACKTIRSPR